MANISEIFIRFTRKVQAKQFEPAEAEVSFTGTLDEGEDHVVAGKALILQARDIVHFGLRGGNTDGPVSTTKSETTEVTVTKGDGTSETTEVPVEEAGLPGGNLEPEDSSRERGKPSVGRKRRTNQQISYDRMMDEMDAKTTKVDAAKAGSDGDDDGLPGTDTAEAATSTDGESPQPEDDSGLPGDTSSSSDEGGSEESGADEGPSADDLQAKITGLVPDKISVAKVKEILAANGASRVQDVKADKRQGVMDQLDIVTG